MTYADAFLARYYHYNYCAYKIKVYSISMKKKSNIVIFCFLLVVNFVFPLERFVTCNPKYLRFQAKNHKKGGEISSLYIYNLL